MPDYNWTCPHCDRDVTITSQRESSDNHFLTVGTAEEYRAFRSHFIVCPNPNCKKFTLNASLHLVGTQGGYRVPGSRIQSWQLVPAGAAKVFPEYIPKVITNDYLEACQIVDLSPKASATLSRRCLQGIIRDFWQVKPGNLVNEIDQIKEKTDATTWAAIDAVRKIGNIGAHMEKDINVIVDVDPEEAKLLISLVETLLTEWYVGKHEREQRMKSIVDAAQAKKPMAAPAVPAIAKPEQA